MPLKFLNASGSGPVSGAISALEYAVKMGVPISNNSWGGGGYSQALYDAIKNSQVIGHLFVAAAGNSHVNSDLEPMYPAAYDLDNIISVAAIDSSDNLASFSNWGVVTVDLGAPGAAVLSTTPGGGYAKYNGTSMATPHVAGVAALVNSFNSGWGYAELKNQILATTRAVEALSGRVLTGGVLNAYQAISNSDPGPVPTPAPTPIPPPSTPLPPFESYALQDSPVEGRVVGSYQDTWAPDGVAEAVSERSTPGQPDTRYDQLEHIWPFAIPRGRPVIVFRVNAWAPASSDGDSIVFEYSLDQTNWTEMFVVDARTRTDLAREYPLPTGVGGRFVYIRVRDTNRTPPSWKQTDTVSVDYMAIKSAAQ
jgi:subtilisin family serine protease